MSNLKKFNVTIPEYREEVVPVIYEVEANSIEDVQNLIDEGTFLDLAEYKESLESPWGFEVRDYDYKNVKIEEAV